MSSMTTETARAVVEVSKTHGAWTAAVPTDERALQEAADQLVGLALNSYTNQIRTQPILDILYARKIEPTAIEAYADVYTAHGVQPPPQPGAAQPQQPVAPAVPAAFAAAAPVAQAQDPVAPGPVDAGPQHDQSQTPAPSAEPGDTVDIDAIFPQYDDIRAKDIVEALKANAASGDLTPQEWDQIRSYEEANEGRKSILSLELTFKPTAPAAAPASQVAHVGPPSQAGSLEQAYGDGSLGQQRALQESLPAPAAVTNGEPVLPVDVTAVSDAELSRLAMQFHSLYSRTVWVLSQEDGRAEAAAHLERESHRAAYDRSYEQLKGQLDKVTASALTEMRQQADRAADGDQSVVTWRERKIQHRIEVGDLKARVLGYESAIARLSREQSRRERISQAPAQG